MLPRGPQHLRKTTNTVLDALIQAAEQAYRNQAPGAVALHAIVEKLKASPDFEDFYRRAYRELMEIVEEEKLELKRTNAFGRLMLRPLEPLLDNHTFDRALLPNVFQFFHLILGDDNEQFGNQCREIVQELKQAQDEEFTWEAFYADPRAKTIQWHTLVRIAASFKRWDVRKDWFLKLMQHTPTTVSVGQSAFVVKSGHAGQEVAEPRIFANREFCLFFHALFSPLTDMLSKADETDFRRQFGTDPHHHIGEFLVHLAACAT